MREDKILVNFTLDIETGRKLEEEARSYGVPRTYILKILVKLFLGELKEENELIKQIKQKLKERL